LKKTKPTHTTTENYSYKSAVYVKNKVEAIDKSHKNSTFRPTYSPTDNITPTGTAVVSYGTFAESEMIHPPKSFD
jgi:hypothetical protein